MFNTIRAMYSWVLSYVRCNPRNTDYLNCMQGLKQGCLTNTALFSFLIKALTSVILLRGKHGIKMLQGRTLLMFTDDIALLSSPPVGFQNQPNVLCENANRLDSVVNLGQTKIVVFRNGYYRTRAERCTMKVSPSVANAYRYIGLQSTTTFV